MAEKRHKHRLQYRTGNEGTAWQVWTASDRCGYGWSSMTESGGLTFIDTRPVRAQTWVIAGADRFPPCDSLVRFRTQLRAFFTLWGGREGPNIPAARRRAR